MRHSLPPLLLSFALLSGCGLDTLDLSTGDFGIGEDVGDNQVEAGAKDFVSCNQGQQCDYLWQQARSWLDDNARFKVTPKSEVEMTAFSPSPDQDREEFQYRITQIPHQDGVAAIKVEAFCGDLEACEDTAVEQVYKINEHLRNHKRAIEEGIVELSGYEEPELPQRKATASTPEEDDGTFGQLSLKQEYRRGQFRGQATQALAGAGCLKQSKMTLLRSATGEDLYEIDCLTGIRHIVFRCNRDGCAVLE